MVQPRSQGGDVDAYAIISEHPGQKPNSKALNELIRLAGLEEKILFVDRPTRFKEVVVPDPGFTKDYYTDQYLNTVNRVRRNAMEQPFRGPAPPEKVFLSRSRFEKARRAEGGLELLDAFFERNGFAILHPETCSLHEMVRVMQNASVCACESGSITFNALFGNENLHLIVIERIPLFANGNLVTNLSRAKRITYVDGGYAVYPPTVGGPSLVGFTEKLKQFADDNGYRHPPAKYLTSRYTKKSFKVFEKWYKEHGFFEQWLSSDKRDWQPVIYEALLDSLRNLPWVSKETVTEEYYR